MNTNLLDFVLSNLDKRKPKWAEVARSTGVPYDTLKKIATRTTPNPGVRHVQVLADYFVAQAPANTAQAAMKPIAAPGLQSHHEIFDPVTAGGIAIAQVGGEVGAEVANV